MDVEVYLSGRFSISAAKEKIWLERSKCKHRCFSFAVVDPEGINHSAQVVESLKVCEEAKVKIMMDSGAFSLHVYTRSTTKRGASAKTKQAHSVEDLQKKMYKNYVAYCLENKHKWAFYVTLDFKREQPIIYKMQKQFLRDGLSPMPVYHGESSLDWLRKYVDMGHKYIAMGGGSFHKGSIEFYYDKCFDFAAKHGIVYHGLAFTSLKAITRWPWKSVDSSTWSRCAAFGQVVMPDFKRIRFYNVHVSERECKGMTNSYNTMSKYNQNQLRGLLKDHGFDIDAMRDDARGEEERHNWNGYMYSNLGNFGYERDKLAERINTWESLI